MAGQWRGLTSDLVDHGVGHEAAAWRLLLFVSKFWGTLQSFRGILPPHATFEKTIRDSHDRDGRTLDFIKRARIRAERTHIPTKQSLFHARRSPLEALPMTFFRLELSNSRKS